jgi:NADH-quinone oxidoreductase subunit H
VATIRAISLDGGVDRQWLLTGIGVALVLLVALSFWPAGDDEEDDEVAAPAGRLDGGFPVPPMPAGGAVQGAAQPLTFETTFETTSVPAGGED